jgi:hypothetical protein
MTMPSWNSEVAAGLKKFEEALHTANLELVNTHRYTDRLATYLVVGSGGKEVDLVLTDEFLGDFPHTREQQQAVAEYVEGLRRRIQNPAPNHFYCVSGIPTRIEIEWPIQWVPNRAASFVWVRIRDLRTGLSSQCSAIMTHQFEIMDVDLKLNPFLREKLIVANIREAIDRDELRFYTKEELPTELPSVRVQKPMSAVGKASHQQVQHFLLGKLYWLGFKQGDKTTRVWLTDPWDAEYLGTDEKSLLQAAQTLGAAELVDLDDEGFAATGRALLLHSDSFELQSSKPTPRKLGFAPE